MRLPDSWSRARVTLAIAVVTAAAWIIVASLDLDEWAALRGAFVPEALGAELAIARVPFWLTPLSATLIHANFIHLAFNLLILVFCGRPTESVLGPVNLLILYVVGAYAAAVADYFIQPVPMIGASGAISAVIGAYAMLFGKNKVRIANPTVALWLNALWLMAAWIVLNVIVGITISGAGIFIAFAAHIGGFVAGILLARPLLLLRYRNA